MALTQVKTSGIADDAVTLAKQAAGTDGQIITYDASGNPVAVGPGTDGQVLTSTGAGSPPAFENLPTSGPTLTGSTDNTICTVTGANAIQGEAKLTFDGDTLKFTHDAVTNFDSNAQDFLVIENGDSDTYINIGTETNRDSGLIFSDDTRARGWYGYNHSGDYAYIGTAGSERFRIGSDGKVYVNRTTALDSNYINFSATKALSAGIPQNQINIADAAAYDTTDNGGAIGFSAKFTSGGGYTTMASIEGVKRDNTDGNYNGDMVFKTRSHNGNNIERMRLHDSGLKFPSGYGIDFSATADAGGGSSNRSELLDDYEEGQWAPSFSDGSSHINDGSSGHRYVKVGAMVTVWGNIRTNSSGTSGTAAFYITGLPFTSANYSNVHYLGPLMGDNGWDEDLSDSNLQAFVYSNSGNIRFWKNSGDSVGSITLNNIGNSANVNYCVSYMAA